MCISFTRTSHSSFCSISCTTHMRGRNATPNVVLHQLADGLDGGHLHLHAQRHLVRLKCRSTTSRYGDTTLCAMKVSVPSSVSETVLRFANRCLGETTKASASL